MLDIETLDTRPSAVILSIGAVRFDVAEPGTLTEKFHHYISIDEQLRAGRTVSGSTLLWWMDQGDEARSRISSANAESMKTVLDALAAFMKPDDRVWGNGAGFDNVIVADAYQSMGMPVPWRFWGDMCFRTLKTMYKYVPKPPRNGTAHDALDDAIHQAEHLQAIFQVMRK
jgi:3' exoribonuclease, RNase T-like